MVKYSALGYRIGKAPKCEGSGKKGKYITGSRGMCSECGKVHAVSASGLVHKHLSPPPPR